MRKYILLILIVFFTGCTFSNNFKNYDFKKDNSSSKKYPNISKDAIFEAAKKVFILAGKKQYRIDSYRDHLFVSKTKLSHFPLIAITHDDRWNLVIEEKDNTSHARLELVRITKFDEENPKYLAERYHELFWSRVDYLLGLSTTWTGCDNFYDFRNALCDPFDMYSHKNALDKDIVENILIEDRKKSKNLNEINDDILNEDIVFTLDESENDILEKEENNDAKESAEKTLDEALEKEIEELDKKVNSNIEETLDKIENGIENDEILNENK